MSTTELAAALSAAGLAAARGDIQTLRALISQHAGLDVDEGDYDKRTAMHLAFCDEAV